MTGKDWYPHAKRVPSHRLNPMNHKHKTRRAVFHYSEGGGTAEWLAHYVNGNRNEYHAVIDAEGHVAQMVPFTSGSRALLNGGIDGGDGCNRSGTRCIQVALVGYTAKSKSTLTRGSKQWKALVELAQWLKEHHGIPLKHVGRKDRDTARYIGTSGWYSHREAPHNDHTDAPWTWAWLKDARKAGDHAHRSVHTDPAHHGGAHRHSGAHGGHRASAHHHHAHAAQHLRNHTILVRDKDGNWSQLWRKDGTISPAGTVVTVRHEGKSEHHHAQFTADEADRLRKEWKAKGWTVEVAKGRHYPWLLLNPGAVWPTDKRLLSRLNDLAQHLGRRIKIISGLRTQAECERLWHAYQSGRGNLAANPWACGGKCCSIHAKGSAADCGVIGADGKYYSMLDHPKVNDSVLRDFRLHAPVRSPQKENWHIQPVEV